MKINYMYGGVETKIKVNDRGCSSTQASKTSKTGMSFMSSRRHHCRHHHFHPVVQETGHEFAGQK